MATGNGSTIVAAKPVGGDATKDHSRDAMVAFNQTEYVQRRLRAIFKRLSTTALRNHTTAEELANLTALVPELQSEFDRLTQFPSGTTIKGGATKADLVNTIAGNEPRREVSARIAKSMEANKVQKFKLS